MGKLMKSIQSVINLDPKEVELIESLFKEKVH